MDLHQRPTTASADERAAVDALLGAPASGWDGGARDIGRDGRTGEGGPRRALAVRDQLLPVLEAVQARIGWLSRGALDYVATRLGAPPAEVWGVASFYHLFALEPTPPIVIHVCDDIACRLRRAEAVCSRLGPEGAPTADGRATWRRSPCLGLCEAAPAALAVAAGAVPAHEVLAPVTTQAIARTLGGELRRAAPQGADARLAEAQRAAPQAGSPGLALLARVGTIDPTSLAAYRATGGYRGLARAIALGPSATLDELDAARLVGRGGAAFPTGKKWRAVAGQAERTRYVVCNADESEPGTFKDRILMEWDPFAVIEGMTIAALATAATRGFIYVRGEYPRAAERLAAAIAAARDDGLLGPDVAGAGFAFELELRRGAGAYICGEETALFNSLEGKRGEPRNKPPFPVAAGLFGKPTVVNNVETLVNVPLILAEGAAAFAAQGTPGSAGPKLFCLSGQVARPGLYEAQFGVTVRDLLARAGGMSGGGEPRAVLLGGAAGSFVGPELYDVPLTLEDLRAHGASLGSGVILAVDHAADVGDLLVRIAQFFKDESCGQCVPCRVGTVRQEELVVRLRRGAPLAGERALLAELGQVMRDASICGLGQTASTAIESAIALGLMEPAHG